MNKPNRVASDRSTVYQAVFEWEAYVDRIGSLRHVIQSVKTFGLFQLACELVWHFYSVDYDWSTTLPAPPGNRFIGFRSGQQKHSQAIERLGFR